MFCIATSLGNEKGRTGNSAVWDLLLNGQGVPAPVAACLHGVLGVDDDLCAACGTLERHDLRDIWDDLG
jgi:hypothetical protein